MAVEFVGAERIAVLNREYRGAKGPTDVLSFPVDEDGAAAGTRELGDVVICPAHTEDLLEAVVHGVLHLTGMDHETDEGEMLALQAEIMAWIDEHPLGLRRARGAPQRRQVDAGQRDGRARRWRSCPTSRRPRGARSAAWPPTPRPASSSS